jgi:hypothetical protein
MGWVVSVTPRPPFTSGERTPGTNWIGGWVGSRAGMDTQRLEEKSFSFAGDRAPVFHSVVRPYTDGATPAPTDWGCWRERIYIHIYIYIYIHTHLYVLSLYMLCYLFVKFGLFFPEEEYRLGVREQGAENLDLKGSGGKNVSTAE